MTDANVKAEAAFDQWLANGQGVRVELSLHDCLRIAYRAGMDAGLELAKEIILEEKR